MKYAEFLESKSHTRSDGGFDPIVMPDWLFPFQSHLVEWCLRRGRAAVFADCGLGKTPMQLVWCDNVLRHTGKPVLILTPLAVSHQTVKEAEKFGIEASRSSDGSGQGIVITNYERLHHFDASRFSGVACDESSILKNFDGATRARVTEFMKRVPYRSLWTATCAPNDYIELGNSSEAIGELGYMDMLSQFFKTSTGTLHPIKGARFRGAKWRFKYHAEDPFWRWVSSWARAVRRPSDLGFDDDGFVLPPLTVNQTIVDASRPMPGKLFVVPAVGLQEQRQERRHTITERCEKLAELVDHGRPAVAWCHLNDESKLLASMIDDCVEVSGSDSDEEKEEKFIAFSSGSARVMVTKPSIGAFGLNWQHCAHVALFPSHSYEQYYQSVRRCWRFGQRSPVVVDVITTRGEANVMENLQRKDRAATEMFESVVAHMNDALRLHTGETFTATAEAPPWL